MKKRIIALFIIICAMLLLTASCSGNDSEETGVPPSPQQCEHSWSEWSVHTEASCTEEGREKRTCSLCGAEDFRTVSAIGHDYRTVTVAATCTEDGSVSEVCSRCGDTKLKSTLPSEGHDYNAINECVKCGAKYSSQGLTFAPYGDGYALISASSATDEFLIIPDEYEGKPVVSVSENAFTDTYFTGIYFPATVNEIKADIALTNVAKLCFASESFPDGVTGENFAGEIVFNAASARLGSSSVFSGEFPEELYFELTDAEGNSVSVEVSEDIIDGEVDFACPGEKSFGIIYDGYVYEVSLTVYEKGTAEIVSVSVESYYRTVSEGLPEITVCFTDVYGYTDEVGLDLLEIVEGADFATPGIKTFTVRYYGKDYSVTAELYDPAVTNVRSVTFDNTVFRVRQGTDLEGYFALTFTGQTVLVNYYEEVNGETAEYVLLSQGDYSVDNVDADTSVTGTYIFYFLYCGYRSELTLEVVPDGEAQYVFTSGDPTLGWTAYLYRDGTAELSGLGYGRYEFVDGLLNVKVFIDGWELSFLFVYDTDENTYGWYDFGGETPVETYVYEDFYVLVYENGLKLCSAENGDGIQFSAEYTLENNKLYSAGYLFEIDEDGNLTVINIIF